MKQLTIMSFNLKNNFATRNSKNYYLKRVPFITEIIEKEHPDIIGTQEMSKFMYDELQKRLTNYIFYGQQRKKTFHMEDIANTILVKKDITVLSQQSLSLGKDPNKVGSKHMLASMPRTCNQLKFLWNDEVIMIYNTHLDHIFQFVRNSEIDCLKQLLLKDDYKKIITGDFNMPTRGKLASLLHEFSLIDTNESNEITEKITKRGLDHIYLQDEFSNFSFQVIDSGKASDHNAIIVEIKK